MNRIELEWLHLKRDELAGRMFSEIGAYQQSCPLVVLLPALPRSYSMMKVIVLEFGNLMASSVALSRKLKRRFVRPAPGRGMRPIRLLRADQPHPPGA